jgi:aminopeptidase YwaD
VMRMLLAVALAIVAAAGLQAVQEVPVLPPALARTIDPIIDGLWSRFDQQRAMADVRFVSRFWRLAGNPGYDTSLNRIHATLRQAGFAAGAPRSASRRPSTWVENYANRDHGWSYSVATLAVVLPGQAERVVLSHETHSLALCINSFSTPASGVLARLIDVGKGDAESDYAGKQLTGAVVLGDAPPDTLWRFAVVAGGAAGVISTQLNRVIAPDPPGRPATRRETWDVLEWGSVPYDEAHRAFGFKVTPRAAVQLREALRQGGGQTRVRASVKSSFTAGPSRTLVAEIPGRSAGGERIVMAAHLQEPGANDNASGVATLAELARSLAQAISSGAIPRPDRTLTFLWLDEIAGSRQWLKDHADEASRVKYMFSLDMTGEDSRLTGGSFLIERWPDPGAVWERPWDPHTEWGGGALRAEQLTGDLINDLHIAVTRRVARKTGWVVKTNPYEGGSDHAVFQEAGIPSVLNWHFTDRYYHSSLDTVDKVSTAEMRNVAVAVGASSWLLASVRDPVALGVAELVAAAGRARLKMEEQEGAALAAGAANPRMARLRQAEIVATWRKWYAQAVRSASRLVLSPASAGFLRRLDELAKSFEG